MKATVPYLNISNKQYKLIGITWGFIFTAMFHFYKYFDQELYSIVKTFVTIDFLQKAVFGMVIGYFVSYYLFRYINRD